jgi:NADH-ubiquinone oxidoreductase chain 2
LLLALSIKNIESVQSFIFYLIQYSISNINAFLILVAIGYSLYYYSDNNINQDKLIDKNNSLIQFISQFRGYFYINSLLAISFIITLFSFAGIPPLIGFFAKQMVFTAALQDGFIFMTLVGVLASVISAVYYLLIVRTMVFDVYSYRYNYNFVNFKMPVLLVHKNKTFNKSYFDLKFALSSSFSLTISILTLVILLFMFIPNELLYLSKILSIVLFVPNSI